MATCEQCCIITGRMQNCAAVNGNNGVNTFSMGSYWLGRGGIQFKFTSLGNSIITRCSDNMVGSINHADHNYVVDDCLNHGLTGFTMNCTREVYGGCRGTVIVKDTSTNVESEVSFALTDQFLISSSPATITYDATQGSINNFCFNLPTSQQCYQAALDDYLSTHEGMELVRWKYTGGVESDCYLVLNSIVPVGCDSSECEDLRSSGSSESCHLIFTTDDPDNANAMTQREYDLLFQPDATHTSGSITLSGMGASGYVGFSALKSVGARFDNSISPVRGNGIVTVYGRAHIMLYGAALGLYPPLEPSAFVNSFDSQEYIIARFVFDDPCCATPTGYSDERDTLVNAIDSWIQSEVGNAAHINNGYIELTRIEWSGFERLTDYCCDDSECTDHESFDNNINLRYPCSSSGGDGSGGCVVDLTCVCDNLALMNRKFDSIIEQLSGLNNKLLQLNGIIEDKDFTVTVEPCSPEITVEPCTPEIVVQPSAINPTISVNPTPITVQPSAVNPTISVNPTPITVEPCTPSITVQPSAVNPTINVSPTPVNVVNNNSIDGLTCDDENIACILKNALNHDNESISKIIKDKDTGAFIDVTVEPNELVNIRKVHYSGFDEE